METLSFLQTHITYNLPIATLCVVGATLTPKLKPRPYLLIHHFPYHLNNTSCDSLCTFGCDNIYRDDVRGAETNQ